MKQVDTILAPIINEPHQHNGDLATYRHMGVDIKEAIWEAQEETAVLFAAYLNANFSLCSTKNKSAYVNKEHGILVNGSEYHYNRLIDAHGKTIKEVFNEWNRL